MNSLVTGATGLVGDNLVKKLVARGDTVRCLVRKSSNIAGLKRMGVELVEGDVRDSDSVTKAVCDMDHVYHSGAAVGIGTYTRSEYYAINADGTRNVVKACKQSGVEALVYVSTQSVTFDFTERVNASENNPSYPSKYKDPYSESKALGEKEVIEAGHSGRLRTSAIRPTFIWGPGDRLMLPTIAKMAKQNQLFLINKGRSEISPSHVDNVCDALMLAGLKEDISGEAFLITDDENTTVGEFTRRMVEAAGLPAPTKSIPYGLAFSLAAVVEKLHDLPFIKSPPSMSRYGVAIMGLNFTFNCEKAKQMLGYRPAVSIDEGMRGLSDWIKEIGGVDKLIN